jgi:apolipoprotein N-acyltransferase
MRAALALLSGLLLALSFPKFGHSALAWVSLAPLLVALTLAAHNGSSRWHSFRLGYVAGLGYFCGTLYWLSLVMARYGELPMAVAGLLAFGLAAWLAVFVGTFALLTGNAVRRYGVPGLWFAPCFWVATEWFRAWLGGNFPWVLLGSSQASALPVVQLASVTGVYGLSAMVVSAGVVITILTLSRNRIQRRTAAIAALGLALIPIWGAWRMSRSDLLTQGVPMRVGLVQGNVPQEQKQDAAFGAAILDRYITLTREAIGAGSQLVLWPEASTPFYFEIEANQAEPIRRLAREAQTPVLVGTDQYEAPSASGPQKFFNGAVLVGPDGRNLDSYQKIHLVPFGEFVPFRRLLFFVKPLVKNVADFTHGSRPTVFNVEGTRFSVAICYEVVYSGLAREFVNNGAQLLTTITNDAWFGRTSAASQHFEQAGIRAVEQGRYLVRSANTGISGGFDPYGRVLARTELFTAVTTTVDVRLLSGRTVYNAIGDTIVYLAFAGTMAGVMFRRRRSLAPPMPRG